MSTIRNASIAGALGLAGLGIGVGVLPAAASDDPASTTVTQDDARPDRTTSITDALAGLIEDGTLTQDQADDVASTLASSDALRGPRGTQGGGRGYLISTKVVTETLSMTPDELRTAMEADGATLASVAQDQGIDEETLVDALVADATERTTAAVEDGKITQDQADERLADLSTSVTEAVESEGHAGRGGRGGPGHGQTGDGSRGDSSDGAGTPSDSSTDSSTDTASFTV